VSPSWKRDRRARPEGAGKLAETAHAAKRYWGYPERLIRLWKSDLTVTPRPSGGSLSIARFAAAIAGYALSGTARTRELEHMWVEPAFIGQGVGRQLFAHLLKRMHAMRVTRLTVASDPNAEGFYRRMGARRIGRVRSRPTSRWLPLLVIRLRPRAWG
jgi:GNAT superfamily N-acetyltransferase